MHPAVDPAVNAVEKILRQSEGPFNVLSTYYTNPDEADRQRRVAAERLTRAVDQSRASVALIRAMERNTDATDDDAAVGALTA